MNVEIILKRTVRNGTRQVHGTYINYLIRHGYTYYWVDTLDGIILRVNSCTYGVSVDEIDRIQVEFLSGRSNDNHTKHISKEEKNINLPIDLWTHLVVEHSVRPLIRIIMICT